MFQISSSKDLHKKRYSKPTNISNFEKKFSIANIDTLIRVEKLVFLP